MSNGEPQCVILLGSEKQSKAVLRKLLTEQNARSRQPFEQRQQDSETFDIFRSEQTPNKVIIDGIILSQKSQHLIFDKILIQHAIKLFKNRVSFIITIPDKFAGYQPLFESFLNFFEEDIDPTLDHLKIVIVSDSDTSHQEFRKDISGILEELDQVNQQNLYKLIQKLLSNTHSKSQTQIHNHQSASIVFVIGSDPHTNKSDLAQLILDSSNTKYQHQSQQVSLYFEKQRGKQISKQITQLYQSSYQGLQIGVQVLGKLVSFYDQQDPQLKKGVFKEIQKKVGRVAGLDIGKLDYSRTFNKDQLEALDQLSKRELSSYESIIDLLLKVLQRIPEPLAKPINSPLSILFQTLETPLLILEQLSLRFPRNTNYLQRSYRLCSALLDLPSGPRKQQKIKTLKFQQSQFNSKLANCSSESESIALCLEHLLKVSETRNGAHLSALTHLSTQLSKYHILKQLILLHLLYSNFFILRKLIQLSIQNEFQSTRINRNFLLQIFHIAKSERQYEVAMTCLNYIRIMSHEEKQLKWVDKMLCKLMQKGKAGNSIEEAIKQSENWRERVRNQLQTSKEEVLKQFELRKNLMKE